MMAYKSNLFAKLADNAQRPVLVVKALLKIDKALNQTPIVRKRRGICCC